MPRISGKNARRECAFPILSFGDGPLVRFADLTVKWLEEPERGFFLWFSAGLIAHTP